MKEKRYLNYEGKHRHGIENKDQIKNHHSPWQVERKWGERVAVKTIKEITAYQGMQTEKGSPVSGEIQFIRLTNRPPRISFGFNEKEKYPKHLKAENPGCR